MNAFAFIKNLKGLAVIAFAATDFAKHVDIGQEMHLNFGHAIALASFAAATLDVETETARGIAA